MKRTTRWTASLLFLLLLSMSASSAAQAQDSLFISGNVITGNLWNAATDRGDGTSGSCSLTRSRVNFYSAPFFTDTTADSYSLSLYYESFQSGFVYLYQDGFDPDDPCEGIVVFGYAPLANIYDIHLDANRQYVFVTSEDRLFGGGGSFQVTISGPSGSNLKLGSPASSAVAVSATPMSPPIVIPSGGGTFRSSVTLTNTSSQPQTVDLWTAITGPTSREPANKPRAWTVGAGSSLTITVKQKVSASFPAGSYTFTVKVGTFPSSTVASDSFTFQKE